MLGDLFNSADGGARWPDRIITGGLVSLIISTPFAIGSAHRDAFVWMEVVIFALVPVWMAKIAMDKAPARMRVSVSEFRQLVGPVIALVLLSCLQLIPVPSRLMRVISPTTYQIYRVSFPGWPLEAPYQGLIGIWRHLPVRPARSLSGSFPAKDSAIIRAGTTNHKDALNPSDEHRALSPPMPQGMAGFKWRTLSLAPTVTASGFVEMLALLSIFFLVLLYPFGLVGERDAEARVYRAIFFTILATAAGVALLGLAQRVWWNGRILWFYLPADWSGSQFVQSPRASGPFVNADHFADYLAMVLPLVVTGVLFSFPLVTSRHRSDLRLFCAAAAFLVLSAVVLSLSRGGWVVAGLGVCGALALSFARARERAPAFLQRLGIRAVPLALGGFALLMLVVLFMIGPSARSEAGGRLSVTLARGEGFQYRPAVWRDTLGMIAHFPLFGVGLGCWPEIFPYYQRPPWIPFFFREAENDYIQFAAEMGLIGFAILICFAAPVIRKLAHGARALPARQLPLFAGLISGLGAAILHESFDFSMHTPANALLFTIMLGLALRIALTESNKQTFPRLRKITEGGRRMYLGTVFTSAAALLLIIAACAQDGRAYPYGIEKLENLARAAENVMAHPAISAAHLKLAIMAQHLGAAELSRRQLWAAIWLDPNNPDARDAYANSLFTAGDKRTALEQISLSVYHAPDLGRHYYLNDRLIPWLLPQEQVAIVRGFADAVAAGFGDSLTAMAEVYRELGRYGEVASLYRRAAKKERDDSQRLNDLVQAGQYYALSGDDATSEKLLKEATDIDSSDPAPYVGLVKSVLGPEGDFKRAVATVENGIRQGADAYTLQMALGEAAANSARNNIAESAYRAAIHDEPTFDATMKLGALYLNEDRPERAALTFKTATEMNPGSIEAFQALGRAQEASYDYYAAGKSYGRAVALAPADSNLRNFYLDFQQRTAASAREAENHRIR